MNNTPTHYIIAGCNGAGKTTVPTSIGVIHRRHRARLRNLFEIFVPIIDSWSLYDNNAEVQPIVKNGIIIDKEKFKRIKESCQYKIKLTFPIKSRKA